MLTNDQIQFLKTEFNITPKKLSEMTLDNWKKIRYSCFEIEGGEAMEAANKDTCYLSSKGEIAASIVDTPYKKLFS